MMSGLVILFLLFDGGIKLVPLEIVTQTSGEIGLPTDASFARLLGVLTLIGVVLYAIPQTAVLGAILLTGYMGGAIATHLRIDSPLFSHTLVRRLSRPADLGRALSARAAPARAHSLPPLIRPASPPRSVTGRARRRNRDGQHGGEQQDRAQSHEIPRLSGRKRPPGQD